MTSVEPVTQHLFDNLGKCHCRACSAVSRILSDDAIFILRRLDKIQAVEPPDVLFHYTPHKIKGSRLKPCRPEGVTYQPATVWLTRDPEGEPLAANAVYRVELSCSPAVVYITDLLGKIEPANAFGLCMSAMLAGSDPFQWWLAYEPLPYTKITKL